MNTLYLQGEVRWDGEGKGGRGGVAEPVLGCQQLCSWQVHTYYVNT